jgi:hypothetical protein
LLGPSAFGSPAVKHDLRLAAESELTRGVPPFTREKFGFCRREEIHPNQAEANLVPMF